MATIFPATIVKSKTARGVPPDAQTAPTAPSTSAVCAPCARPEKVLATAVAPRTNSGSCARGRDATVRSARSTTSGSSNASNALKSPLRAGRQERLHDGTLARVIGGGRRRALHAASCAAGELPCRHRRPPHDRGDLVERHAKDVVQDKGEPLGGVQRLQDDQQGRTDRVGQQRFLLGIGAARAAHNRPRRVRIQWCFTAGVPRLQHIQAHPRDHGRQPASQVLHAVGAGAADPQPGLLDGIVRLSWSSRAAGTPPPACGRGGRRSAGPATRVRPSLALPSSVTFHRRYLSLS